MDSRYPLAAEIGSGHPIEGKRCASALRRGQIGSLIGQCAGRAAYIKAGFTFAEEKRAPDFEAAAGAPRACAAWRATSESPTKRNGRSAAKPSAHIHRITSISAPLLKERQAVSTDTGWVSGESPCGDPLGAVPTQSVKIASAPHRTSMASFVSAPPRYTRAGTARVKQFRGLPLLSSPRV